MNHPLTAQGSYVPFFKQGRGYNYAWAPAEYYLQQNTFRQRRQLFLGNYFAGHVPSSWPTTRKRKIESNDNNNNDDDDDDDDDDENDDDFIIIYK